MHSEYYNKNDTSLCLIASCVLHALIALLLLFFHHYITLIPESSQTEVIFINTQQSQPQPMPAPTRVQPNTINKAPAQPQPTPQQPALQEEPEDLSKYLPISTQKGDPSKPKNAIQFPGKKGAEKTKSPLTESPMDANIEEKAEKDDPQDKALQNDPLINDEITNKNQKDQRPLSLLEEMAPPSTPTTINNVGFLIPQKPMPQQTQESISDAQHLSDNSGRKRRLTLADVFKQLPTLYSPTGHGHPRGVENGVDTGDALIIAQTDFRFYGFFTNVLAHLNNTLAFHRQEMDPSWNFSKMIHVDVIVDKKGYVQEVLITQSSGVQSLDHFIKKITHAASPLPPVPASLSHKTFRLKLIWGSMT